MLGALVWHTAQGRTGVCFLTCGVHLRYCYSSIRYEGYIFEQGQIFYVVMLRSESLCSFSGSLRKKNNNNKNNNTVHLWHREAGALSCLCLVSYVQSWHMSRNRAVHVVYKWQHKRALSSLIHMHLKENCAKTGISAPRVKKWKCGWFTCSIPFCAGNIVVPRFAHGFVPITFKWV